ncbi:hypothetical protein V0R37_21975, partial [Pollutimonas sp. H1-120]|uniref:hypothetical protein n=1 Tax=Pollutimonas sp. H1-120 TaxID=3148824 RepID=UPI003B53035D
TVISVNSIKVLPVSYRRAMNTAALSLALLMLTGCASLGNSSQPEAPKPDLSELAHQAAQQMMASNPDLTRYSPMIAATFVSIDNLSQSSTFG